MKDRKFGSEVVSATQEVKDLNGVNQTVTTDTSDIESLSIKDAKALSGNASHKIHLKQDKQA